IRLYAHRPLSTPRRPPFPYTTLFRSHGHAHVVEAIRKQAAELPVIGPNFANRPAARLAEMLSEVTPVRSARTFFTNGGAEANERSEEHTSELQSRVDLVCRLLLEKKK